MALILGSSPIDFEKLSLGIPNQLQKDVYFSRIFLDDNPLYIQTNECFTSTGIKETNKKGFCDLIYSDCETVSSFFVGLEKAIRDHVLENKDDWFEESFTSDELEDSFTTSIGYHKQGIRLRTYIHKHAITERYNLNCYNYNHELISNEKLIIGTKLIPIIEIVGIRFTDKNFSVELKLVQTLITNMECTTDTSKPMFSGLINGDSFIKPNVKENENDENVSSDHDVELTLEISTLDPTLEKGIPHEEESSSVRETVDVKSETIPDNKEDIKDNEVKNLENVVESELTIDEVEVTLEKKIKEEEPDKSLSVKEEKKINNGCIEEIDIYGNIVDGDTPVKLKTHADIYKEIWKMYREEAFKVRQQNIKFMLNSKIIHTNYLINEI